MTHNITHNITENLTAIIGICSTNAPEYLHDDIDNAINVDRILYRKKHPADWYLVDYPDVGNDTYLIGFVKDDNDEYEPDKTAEYSAIVERLYTQIIISKFVSKCALCSPRYSGAGDLDTAGDIITYTLPPEVWGDAEHLPISG